MSYLDQGDPRWWYAKDAIKQWKFRSDCMSWWNISSNRTLSFWFPCLSSCSNDLGENGFYGDMFCSHNEQHSDLGWSNQQLYWASKVHIMISWWENRKEYCHLTVLMICILVKRSAEYEAAASRHRYRIRTIVSYLGVSNVSNMPLSSGAHWHESTTRSYNIEANIAVFWAEEKKTIHGNQKWTPCKSNKEANHQRQLDHKWYT